MLSYNMGHSTNKSSVLLPAQQRISRHSGVSTMSSSYHTSISNGYKSCRSCGRTLPINCFTKHTAKPDGLSPKCKDCQREGRKNRVEYQANYHAMHKAERKASNALYVSLNRTRISERQSRWYYEHQSAVKERVKEHHKANPQIARAANRRRKDRMKGICNAFSAKDWRFCLCYWGGVCAYCGNPPSLFDRDLALHMDHYVPVSDIENCPGTVPTNILPACQTCNYSKKAHAPHEWLVSKFGKCKAAKIEKRIREYFDSLKEKVDAD